MKLVRLASGIDALLLGLLIVSLHYTQQTVAHAQVTGGGSTDFKRPANPPVNRISRVEPAGGRLKDEAETKSGGRSQSLGTVGGGTQKGTSRSAANKGVPARSVLPPRVGGLKSGGGVAATPKPTPQPGSSERPTTTSETPATAEDYEDVEAAIEAGNNARDRKPPDHAEAERAYKRASEMAPSDSRSFEGLGNVYYDQQRNEEAVAAYRKAVELKPKNPAAFENLGDVYYRMGRYQESIEASSQSVRLDPKPAGPYWTLTWSTLTLGQAETAGKMADAFIQRWRPLYAGEAPYYVTFAGYLGYLEAGRRQAAESLLASPGTSSNCQDQNWVCRLLKYLRHEISAEQLLSEANSIGRMTEARAYIGMDLALSGKKTDALTQLRWVVANGDRSFTEYPLARAWVAKLEGR